jgi:hypothetical protein
MNARISRLTLFLLLACGSLSVSAAQGSDSAMTSAERRQMTEDMSPRAQYNRSVKEAHAAYADAVKECGRMRSGEKTSCMQEAKTNLKNDLASAREQMGTSSAHR